MLFSHVEDSKCDAILEILCSLPIVTETDFRLVITADDLC